MEIKVRDRDIVIPGQELGEHIKCDDIGSICFREREKIFSSVVGMARVEGESIKVISSTGGYIPKEEDVIIGIILEIYKDKMILDINSPYPCIILKEQRRREDRFLRSNNSNFRYHPRGRRERSEYREEHENFNDFKVGDVVSAKISKVNEVNSSQAIKPWKLEKGLILEVNAKRVPRIIGKKKSMLNLIKEKTLSSIIVGQNGRIWIKGPREEFIADLIKKIVKEAQTQGLTDRIEEFLNEEVKKWH